MFFLFKCSCSGSDLLIEIVNQSECLFKMLCIAERIFGHSKGCDKLTKMYYDFEIRTHICKSDLDYAWCRTSYVMLAITVIATELC